MRTTIGINSIAQRMSLSPSVTNDSKMPINFLWVGFILSALPEAKIIHLDRDPSATCWSIYYCIDFSFEKSNSP